MSILKTKIPASSILLSEGKTYDYIDSYEGEFYDKNNSVDITQIGKAFFTSGPKWIEKLFSLRNNVVKFFGLKIPDAVADRQKALDNFNCEPGEQLGLFKVFAKTQNEVILGEDDKHLNFRISLFIDKPAYATHEKRLTLSTTVIYNNRWGRLYFIPVKPFHSLIVPVMLKGIIKQIKRK